MQEKNKLNISWAEMLYLGFWMLMLFTKGIGLYDGQALYKVFLAAGLGMIFLKMCLTPHTKKEWLMILVTGLLMAVIYLTSKEKGIVLCTVTVLAMKGVSIRRVMKTGLWVWGITMGGNILYHLINYMTYG